MNEKLVSSKLTDINYCNHCNLWTVTIVDLHDLKPVYFKHGTFGKCHKNIVRDDMTCVDKTFRPPRFQILMVLEGEKSRDKNVTEVAQICTKLGANGASNREIVLAFSLLC